MRLFRRCPRPTWMAAAADHLAAELGPGDVITSFSVQATGPDGQRMLYALDTAGGDVRRFVYTPDQDVLVEASEVMGRALIEVGEGL